MGGGAGSIFPENFVDYKLDNSSISTDIKAEVRSLLVSLNQHQLAALKSALADIEYLINERKKLHAELLNVFEKLKVEIDNAIMDMPNVPTNLSSEAFKALTELRKKKIEIEELILEEKLNFWRDIANLKKEAREHRKKLIEKERATPVLDDLIGL